MNCGIPDNMGMTIDTAPHLIVPFAQCTGDDWLQTMSSVESKNLTRLLGSMQLVETDSGLPDSLSLPWERVIAKAGALPANADGMIPLAAAEAQATPGEGWAFITPCHWAMGREHATLTDPATLDLSEAESRTLLTAMQPYFATEGITLNFIEPTRWLARGDIFASLPTASLDRVLGRNVDRWLPASKAVKLLQNEMQMLLYTHPVNEERTARGLRSVNSFWVSGSGALATSTTSAVELAQTAITRSLAQPALANDWTAYAQAWVQLDLNEIANLLARQNKGETVRISLCGESNSKTFRTAKHGILSRMKNVLSPPRPIDMLKQL